MKRGAVASPVSIEVLDTGGFNITDFMSRADINYYCLYWDKLVIPASNEVYFPVPGEDELLKLGVVERPLIKIGNNSDNYAHVYPVEQVRIFEGLQSKGDDYYWSLHQTGNDLVLPSKGEEKRRNLQLELLNALPVPSHVINPEKILEFKNKNSDSYLYFHNYLDELYSDVAFAPDEPLFQKKAYQNFKGALADLNKISEIQEDFIWQRYNLKLSMPNSNDFAQIVLGALTAVADTSNPYITSLGLLSAGIGFIKVQDKYEHILNKNDAEANLIYLANAYKEKII